MFDDIQTRAFPNAELGITPRSSALNALMKQHELSFAPKPPQGKGRGRTYAYTDEQFVELHAAAGAVTGDDRKRLLDEYGIGWSTLQKKAGAKSAPKRRGGGQGGASPAPRREKSIFEQIDALADNAEAAIEELEREREGLQERIEEIEKKKEMLRRFSQVATEQG